LVSQGIYQAGRWFMVVDDDGLWSLVVSLSERSSFVYGHWTYNELLSVALCQVALNVVNRSWSSMVEKKVWLLTLLIATNFATEGDMQQCLAVASDNSGNKDDVSLLEHIDYTYFYWYTESRNIIIIKKKKVLCSSSNCDSLCTRVALYNHCNSHTTLYSS
jgi:hypothetical protein